MYIGLTSSQLVSAEPKLAEVSEVLNVIDNQLLRPHATTGMTVQMSPEVIQGYLGMVSVMADAICLLRGGIVINLEEYGSRLIAAGDAWEKACQTGVTVL